MVRLALQTVEAFAAARQATATASDDTPDDGQDNEAGNDKQRDHRPSAAVSFRLANNVLADWDLLANRRLETIVPT
ncbi:hypothetical protein O1611_g5331 [Lasiodiplodia mahajangana]|uniref:Uncharacterized protein n=1 Tax=Lasiodiplodia mahajangana TaxID=1108764 RepID=A0ACC2JLK6_9PEZI|nr:hypothetical protein O1611_g5331 [Lasiodiplodia mahajangana]